MQKIRQIKYYSLWFSLLIIILFALQVIFPTLTDLFVLNKNIYSGEIWRVLTAIFVHGSLTHLLYNLFALALFGFILENIVGSKRFLTIFFSTGIIANLISVNFYNSSLGASGAIMGLTGALTILRPKLTVWAFSIPMPLFIATTTWIIGDIIGIFNPSGTGNIAHLSGVFFGFIFGLIYLKKLGEKKAKEVKIKISEDVMDEWERIYLKK